MAPAGRSGHEEPASGATAKEAAAGFTFHKEEKKAKASSLAVPLLLVLLLGGGAAYYFLVMRPQAKGLGIAVLDRLVRAATGSSIRGVEAVSG